MNAAHAADSAAPGATPAPQATADPIIRIIRAKKAFGETQALRDVTFSARRGEIHAIVGENGSGKSTLAKVISGIVLVDSGEVSVAGEQVRNPRAAIRAGVATIFQEVLVAEGATVADNVFLGSDGLWRATVSRPEKYRRTAEVLEALTGTVVDPDEIIDNLPLAMRQWVTIARAIIQEPKVVVFDESTAALDLESASRLYGEMQKLRDAGACVLVVTHRIAELTSFADRATVLRDGADVGVIEGADITLDRLLEMMSGVAPAEVEEAQEARQRPDFAERDPVLAANAVSTGFGNPSDLSLRPGEIIGFAGLDGQGQAEFLQAISGIRTPVGGSVVVTSNGESTEVSNLTTARTAGVAYISGDRRKEGIFTNLSILENFAMPLYQAAVRAGIINRGAIRARYEAEMKALRLRAGSADHPITSLSGGNQQKVLIGRVLAQEPRVVTLNDPARGVDIRTKRELYEQLHKLTDSGAAVVYLSTEVDELVGLCDRVAVFRDGAIFGWLTGAQINSERILAAMFGHMEKDFDIEDALAGQ